MEALKQQANKGNSPTASCKPKGMPIIMEQPYPMEIINQGDTILLRLEEYDIVRTVHMTGDAVPAMGKATPLGYSVGHMENNKLIVRTSAISWPFFNQLGIPLTESTTIVEHFTPTYDGSRLNYRAVITEPLSFSEPVVLEKFWLWLPEAHVEPFNCTTRPQ